MSGESKVTRGSRFDVGMVYHSPTYKTAEGSTRLEIAWTEETEKGGYRFHAITFDVERQEVVRQKTTEFTEQQFQAGRLEQRFNYNPFLNQSQGWQELERIDEHSKKAQTPQARSKKKKAKVSTESPKIKPEDRSQITKTQPSPDSETPDRRAQPDRAPGGGKGTGTGPGSGAGEGPGEGPRPVDRSKRQGKGFDSDLGERVGTASDVADIVSEQIQYAKEDADELKRQVDEWVLDNGGAWSVAAGTLAATGLDALKLAMGVTESFTDALRFGQGMAKGGVRGLLEDLGRGLSLVPGAKVVSGAAAGGARLTAGAAIVGAQRARKVIKESKFVANSVIRANKGGLVRGIKGVAVDVAVQQHKHAGVVRKTLHKLYPNKAFKHGRRYNSAPLNPQTFFKGIPGYKGRESLTMLLPTKMKGALNKDWPHKLADIHRQFDAHWKKFGKALHENRKNFPNEEIPASLLFQTMQKAVRQMPHLDQKTKNTIEHIMTSEFVTTMAKAYDNVNVDLTKIMIKIPKITSF